MSYSTLKLEFDGYTARITLNRPEKRNAISSVMIGELTRAFAEIANSPARLAILTGAGKAFCAGMDLADLRAMAAESPQRHLEDAKSMAEMFYALYASPKPVIAAVNGAAIAGGCGLATLADFTLAVPEAKFGYTEVRVGFLPAVVSVFLRRQVGERRARDLLLTGRIFDAQEALAMGLVNALVPAEGLDQAAHELASALEELSPASLLRTKRLLLRAQEKEIERDLAAAIQESADMRSTSDFREGLSAFLEKRKPQWPQG